MSRRSPAAVLVASALTVVLVSGYAGPGLCAAVHGRPADAEHCSQPSGHSTGTPQLTSAVHTTGCPDAAHCGVGVTDPIARGTSSFVTDLTHQGPTGGQPSRPLARSTAPPAPPPKV
jgi:hypothetical protein